MRLKAFILGVVGFLSVGSVRADLVITEVLYDPAGVDTGSEIIELTNTRPAALDMGSSGYWLYFAPASWRFPPNVVVPPGGVILLHVNRTLPPGESADNEYYTGVGGMRSLNRDDSISLFRTNLFGDSSQIIDFVQWGHPGLTGEDVAVAAGLWVESEFVDVVSLQSGSTVSKVGEGPGADAWCVDGSPSLGAANDECTFSASRSPIALMEVGDFPPFTEDSHPVVEMLHVGTNIEDLGGKVIAFGGESVFEFPPTTLIAAGEMVLLHVGVSGVDTALEFFTGPEVTRALQEPDSLSFHASSDPSDPHRVIEFVQWGAAGTPIEQTAVAAERWTDGEFVDTSNRQARGSISSRDPSSLSGLDRWGVDNTPTLTDRNDAIPVTPLVVNEVLIDPAGDDVGATAIELRVAIDDLVLDLSRYTVCFESKASKAEFSCYSIPENIVIGPGDLLVLRVNQTGEDSQLEVFTGAFLDLTAASGAIAIYAVDDLEEPNNLLDYFRWGDGCVVGETVAAGVGIWSEGETVSVLHSQDDSSIAYRGRGNSPSSYRVDRSPSIGIENTEKPRQDPFRRGDCNDSGNVDISDAISMFNILFLGAQSPLCDDACDGNNDDLRDVSDPVFLLNFLFRGGRELALPALECGEEEIVDELTCDAYLSCPTTP